MSYPIVTKCVLAVVGEVPQLEPFAQGDRDDPEVVQERIDDFGIILELREDFGGEITDHLPGYTISHTYIGESFERHEGLPRWAPDGVLFTLLEAYDSHLAVVVERSEGRQEYNSTA